MPEKVIPCLSFSINGLQNENVYNTQLYTTLKYLPKMNPVVYVHVTCNLNL